MPGSVLQCLTHSLKLFASLLDPIWVDSAHGTDCGRASLNRRDQYEIPATSFEAGQSLAVPRCDGRRAIGWTFGWWNVLAERALFRAKRHIGSVYGCHRSWLCAATFCIARVRL